jgi:superoxide dismutase
VKNTPRALKLRESGIKKFGSLEAWREFQRSAASKSSRNSKGTGGFAWLKANDPDRLKAISSAGGKKSSRKVTNE